MENSSKSSSENGGGNTISPPVKQCSPSKKWCFTLNNYTSENENDIRSKIESVCKQGGFGKEVGESGTAHLQGWVEFKIKSRPVGIFPKGMHWEKMKGSITDSITYCSKDGDYWGVGHLIIEPLRLIETLRPWQQKVVDKINTVADERTINWLWEDVGGIGKTSLCKLLCAKYGALLVSGKAADMKYLITEYNQNNPGCFPKCILFDVPRTSMGYLSYTGMEEIKNGLFASTKYECKMLIFNCPHVFVFANSEPDYGAMSTDRWNIICMNEE